MYCNMNRSRFMSHQENLNHICRTSGERIKLTKKSSHAKSVENYRAEIQYLFKYDILNDLDDIHPKFICENCRKKLDRVKLSPHQFKTNSSLPLFKSHTDENCEVCKFQCKGEELSLTTRGDFVKVKKMNTKSLLCFATKYGFENVSKVMNCDLNTFCFAKITCNNSAPVISISVVVTCEGSWIVKVYGQPVQGNHLQLPNSLKLDSDIELFFDKLSEAKICIGNPDFQDLLQKRINISNIEEFKDKDGADKAHFQSEQFVGLSKFTTIRHVDCIFFASPGQRKCKPCLEYYSTLKTLSWRMKNAKHEVPAKNTNNKYLSKEQLQEKAATLYKEVRSLRKSVSHLENNIIKAIHTEGENVPVDLHKICSDTINSESCLFPPDSVQSLLWEQQKKQAALSNKHSMKWHPVMIRWCVSLYLKSPSTYEHLKTSGFLTLPHKSTILQYANFTEPTPGLNIEVVKHLINEIKGYNKMQRNVGLLYDEMKIKSGLVYNRHNGKLIGFTELGNINNELEEFKNKIEGDIEHKPLATHIITFMVKGLASSLAYPIAYYPSQGFTSDQLFPPVWECVRVLESIDLNVRFFTSDGAAPNRRFYRLHAMNGNLNVSVEGVVYWCYNRYAGNNRKIYFICDVPHLMKTSRNNLENSHFHNNTRNLMVSLFHLIC